MSTLAVAHGAWYKMLRSWRPPPTKCGLRNDKSEWRHRLVAGCATLRAGLGRAPRGGFDPSAGVWSLRRRGANSETDPGATRMKREASGPNLGPPLAWWT